MKLKKPGLLPRIVIAIALGIGAGYLMPEWGVRVFATFNAIFSEFLGFIIPLLIVAFVAPAIADVGRGAGKMLAATAGVAYLATLLAGFGSFAVSDALFPSMITPTGVNDVAEAGELPGPFFTVAMPPLMGVSSALVLAFVLGLGTAALPQGNAMKRVLDNLRDIITGVVNGAILPLLPLYIFGIFLGITMSGQVVGILSTFAKIIAVIFVMHIAILVLQFGVAAFFSRGSRNPLKLLSGMLPAYFTALGTQSSAATIPVTLERAVSIGVPRQVAGFTIPLCATIHMSGSTLKIVACAVALMLTNGMPYTTGMFAALIFMLGVTIIAAPGVPGGSIMASLGVLSSILGFSEADNALMIALYITMDSFGTACNVTGDGAISIIIARLFPRAAETVAPVAVEAAESDCA